MVQRSTEERDLHGNIRRVPVTHRLQLRNQLIAGLVFIPQALPSAVNLETGGPRWGVDQNPLSNRHERYAY